MSSIKKIIVWALALCMLLSICPMGTVFAETALEPLPATEGVTRVGIFSDSHIGNENGSKNLEKALQTFSTIAPDYDGLAMAGDIIVQYGTVADDYKVDSAPYDLVLSDLNEYAKSKPYSWAMGNHEFPGACVLAVSQSEAQTALMEAAIEKSKEYYVEKTGMQLNDDVVIGGYHFITAAPIDYSNCFDEAAENYIMSRIDAAIEADGNEKPIFLNIHHAPWYTTLSSTETVYNIPYSETFTDYLEEHPNVIIFTGHTHHSEYDPRTIWQGGYTVVNVGHTSNGGGAGVSGEIVYDRSNQEAVMLEISADNVVTIKKVDVENQCYIGEDWVLDIPNMVNNPDNEEYWKYTDSRYDSAPTPMFAEDATVSLVSATETTAKLSFPQAQIESFMGDDIIRYYNVKIVNRKLQSLVQDYDIAADFYNPPSMRANPFVFTVDELYEGTEYVAEITAYSPYGKVSNTIKGVFNTAKKDIPQGGDTTVATTPEADTRKPVFKYVAAADETGAYVPAYSDVNSPGRNRKKVDPDENGVYPEGSYVEGENHYVHWFGRDTRFGFGGHFLTFYESGNYVEFELSVETSGLYELMAIGANATSSDMGVFIDGFRKATFAVPVNNNGPFGDSKYDGTYAPVGQFYLEAGTHKVKFLLESQAKSQLVFWGAALAKVEDLYVDYMFCKEGTPLANHFADYSTAKDVMAYQFYGDGWGYIDFTVDVPYNGEYILSAETGSRSKKGLFEVYVDDKIVTEIDVPIIDVPVLNNIISVNANDSLLLSKGTHKLRLWAKDSSPYLRSISLMNYKRADKWQAFHTSSDAVISYSDGGAGDNNLANGLIMMRSNGYITYEFTAPETGKYDISWDVSTGGCFGQTFVNGDAVTDEIEYKQSRGYTPAYEVFFLKGNTYEITFKATKGADSYYFDVYNMKVEYIGAPENGGEGVYIDIFASDSTNDNYDTQSAGSLKYGDGRGSNGWGCYGGLFTEYEFDIEYAGWYDINAVLGCGGSAIVKIAIDGNEIATKYAEYVEGETWSVKRDNSFGEIFLLEGPHTMKISGGDGTFMIFKTRFSFDRIDDGTSELTFNYEAVDYTNKGGSNVQTYYNPYGGVVLGEGNSFTEYVVDVPAGNYAFEICYGANSWDGQMSITLNGAMLGVYALPQNNTSLHYTNYDREAYYTPEILSLNEGINTIKLRCEKFPSGSGYAYFSFTTFKLTRITEPEVQLYHGEYITPDTQKTVLANGANTVRVYMPIYLENEEITLYAAVYEGGRLVDIATDYVDEASVNEVMIATFEDFKLDETKTYTMKVFAWDSANGLSPLCSVVPVIQ